MGFGGKVWLGGVLGLLTVCCFTLMPVSGHAAKTPEELMRDRKIVARWHITGHGQLQEAHRRGLDVWEEHPDPRMGYFTVMITEAELAQLRQVGYQIEVMQSDYYQARQALAMVPNGGFRTWAQCVALMDSIHTAHPTITTAKYSIGWTGEGRQMWAMKISDNPDVDEAEPEVLFNGMHHAREPIGMEVCLETMNRLTNGYGTDTLITRLVDSREIFFVPIVNVDGYEWNRMNWPNGGGMWRKNRVDNGDGTYGVDLNRNYGYMWGYDNEGSSPVTSSETYRGIAAFSEPETQKMRALINARHFVFAINYHSYSNLLLWPWGYDYIYTPDEAFFTAVGESVVTYNGFTPQVGWQLYPTNGDADDWGYGAQTEHTKIYAFTPEVGTWAEGGFWPDPSFIPAQIAKCQGPNLVIIELADTPERIFPPAMPTWVSPGDTVGSGSYSLGWSDPGGLNAAVAFKLDEMFGPHVMTDDAEGGMTNWIAQGFTLSTAHAASGTHSYFGGYAHGLRSRLTTSEYYRVQPNDTLHAKVWYDIETDWDYAYAEISTDGGAHFTPLAGNRTTGTNPYGNNRGNGITGTSGGVFVNATFPLTAYNGQDVLFRLSYETDEATLGSGVFFDDVGRIQAYDSVVTLAAATPATTFAVSGKSFGTYQYRVQATDAQGQKSRVTAPRRVTAYFVTLGDMNNDAAHDVMDIVLLIDYVFRGGSGSVLPGAAECNCVPGVDVMDIVLLIDHVFRGGPAPSCP
jgi:hypothetical protein